MTKIKELIQDFKLNQEILGRVKRYIDVCMFRLYRWERFMEKELGIQERQRLGREVNRTLNNNPATLKG